MSTLQLKKKNDEVTDYCVTGYIKKEYDMAVPIYIQYLIMDFYSKEEFDKYGPILQVNKMKNEVEMKNEVQTSSLRPAGRYNSIWCFQDINTNQPYVYSWIMKIINVMSNHLQIGISCDKYEKASTTTHKSLTSYNTTCYGHNFESNS
eukprot:27998_1